MDLNISKGEDWWRYLAQDSDGMWAIYKTPPKYSLKFKAWLLSSLDNKYANICKTEVITNNESTIIDLEEYANEHS